MSSNNGRLEPEIWEDDDVTAVREPIALPPEYFAHEPRLDRVCRIAGPDGCVVATETVAEACAVGEVA